MPTFDAGRGYVLNLARGDVVGLRPAEQIPHREPLTFSGGPGTLFYVCSVSTSYRTSRVFVLDEDARARMDRGRAPYEINVWADLLVHRPAPSDLLPVVLAADDRYAIN